MIYAVNKKTKEHLAHSAPCLDDVARFPGWDYIQADADGWIEWKGGECPLPTPGVNSIEIRWIDGIEESGYPEEFRWSHIGDHEDIIAYRQIPGSQLEQVNMENYTVIIDSSLAVQIEADDWECGCNGLKFSADGKVVAWFTSFSGFYKNESKE